MRLSEAKTIQLVQDELGQVLWKKGGASIAHWRKGYLPSKLSDVESLAREIVRRGRLDRAWLEQFLRSADHPNPTALCDELFPPNLPTETPFLFPDRAPAAPPQSATGYRLSTLPAPLTPLIGREDDLAAALDYFRSDDVRLLTLTGAPGVGKTRLALQLASDLQTAFDDGAFFVPLAPIRDPDLVVSAIAPVLGVGEAPSQSLAAQLTERVHGKHLLLLLDNFEQVVLAAPLVVELLQAAPRLKVLVTSREPLRVYGEHEFLVQPLAFPDPGQCHSVEAVTHSSAVRLFIERARAANFDFRLTRNNAAAVAEICARLDGLPLAIELIAARIKRLSPHDILAQLNDRRLALLTGGARDRPARHQTLREAIDWSYALLASEEQELFARLAAFAGGGALPAVGVVCAPGDQPLQPEAHAELEKTLEALADKKLVQLSRPTVPQAERRFVMLETIGEYARHKLQATGDAESVRRRHRDWFLALAEQAEQELRGPNSIAWLNQLDREYDNLRAALAWCLEHPAEVDAGLRLAGALHWFWHLRGHYGEGRDWLNRMLSAATTSQVSQPTRQARAKALQAAGWLEWLHGDLAQAVSLSEEALALFRELNDSSGIAFTLANLAIFAEDQSDYSRAALLAEEGLALMREIGSPFGTAQLLDNVLGFLALEQGHYSRAEALIQEALRLRRELGDTDGMAYSFFGLGHVARAQGDYVRARTCYQEARTLWQAVGNKRWLAFSLLHLGRVARAEGDFAQAEALLEASLTLHRAQGDQNYVAYTLGVMGYTAYQQGNLNLAALRFKESLSLLRMNPAGLDAAQVLAGLAWVANRKGDAGRATQLLGALESLRQTQELALHPANRTEYDRARADMRASLGEDAFQKVWAAGRTMTLEQAIAYALAED